MPRRKSLTLLVATAVLMAGGGAVAEGEDGMDADVAFASELFDLTPGSWEQVATLDGSPAPTSMQMCVDETVKPIASATVPNTGMP